MTFDFSNLESWGKIAGWEPSMSGSDGDGGGCGESAREDSINFTQDEAIG